MVNIINPDDPVFPYNIIELLVTRFELLDYGFSLFRRRLTVTDPNLSIGCSPLTWAPNNESFEIGVLNAGTSATLSQYDIRVQGSVKDADEVRGQKVHSYMAEMIRSILEDDTALHASLSGLTATVLSTTKRLKRHWVAGTNYISAEGPEGSKLWLSTSRFMVETEKAQ
jgi:hypothetical protein